MIGLSLGGLAVLAAVLGALALQDASRIRGDLHAARATLLQAGGDPALLQTSAGRVSALGEVDRALASIDVARSRATGSRSISILGSLPGLRGQRRGLVQLIDDFSVAAGTGRDLLKEASDLADQQLIREGSVPLTGLLDLQARLKDAGRKIGVLAQRDSRLWGPLGDARRTFKTAAEDASERLLDGSDAAGAVRTFLGADGPRRYLVALQNNAEMRDQGAVLSYVVLEMTDGRIEFSERGSVGELTLSGPADVDVPPGTAEVFGSIAPTQTWQSVNATADFGLSGEWMAAMYRQATGDPVDGVIALDVPGLAGLLRVLGPVNIEGVAEPISSENVGRLLLNDFYQGLSLASDQTERRERQGEVVEAVVERLTSGSRDALALGSELGGAAAGGHFRMWSAQESEQTVFERSGIGGGPANVRPDRTFHLAVENRTATKLDYFVKPRVRYEVHITDAGTAVVRTIVTIDNLAPVGAAPSYALGPDQFTERPGDYLAWVLLWGPAGSDQLQGGIAESGLNLAQRVIDVGAGEQREITFETVVRDAVRDGVFELRVVPQPRLEPMLMDVVVTAEGWKVKGNSSVTAFLDRTMSIRWEVSR